MSAFGTFELDSRLWEPQQRAVREIIGKVCAGRDVLLQSPTGSGKTRMAIELMRWALWKGTKSSFYLNRKLLVGQTASRLDSLGFDYGVRAADYEDKFDPDAAIQISSADTERARVYGPEDDEKRKSFVPVWPPHECDLVFVDEAHIQKGATMQRILDDHRSRGAQVVLLSATPVATGGPDYDLVIAGSLKEFRDCGALVKAHTFSIEQPDLAKVKRSQTGEYIMDGKQRKLFTQHIVGNVVSHYKTLNPDGRPAMLYAPGKEDSVWFAQEFSKAGISWCHVDATEAYFDGKRYTLNRSLWSEILEKYRDGEFKGISSRFKLREGVDVPSTYHIILATPIGSLASYLQTVGRGLRAAPDADYQKDKAIIQDHGGNYWRHGSANEERDWAWLSQATSHAASTSRIKEYVEGERPEPIRCPICFFERLAGIKCANCGHTHEKGTRAVLQEDGTLVQRNGALTKRRQRREKNDTQCNWDNMYWGYKRRKLKKSFAQMEAFFFRTHGYYPPRSLSNMPVSSSD